MESSKKDKILSKSLELFHQLGIRSLNMDDIARKLGISKKTLYQHFSNKDDLVKQAFERECFHDRQIMEEIKKNSRDAIDEVVKSAKYVMQKLIKIHPSVHFDLEKYYGESYQMIQQLHKEFYLKKLNENALRGKKEGFYRKDFNEEIVNRFFLLRIDAFIDASIFPLEKLNFSEIFVELLRYHIYGIATDQGKIKFEEYMKKEE